MAGYWTDLSSTPELMLLTERLDRYVENATRQVDPFDPDAMLAHFLRPLDQAWLNPMHMPGEVLMS